MGKRIPRDAFKDIVPAELQKGRDERLVLQPWVRNGYAYVSLGIKERDDNGVYAFLRKKGFALSIREAKELVILLAAVTFSVEQRMYQVLDDLNEPSVVLEGEND